MQLRYEKYYTVRKRQNKRMKPWDWLFTLNNLSYRFTLPTLSVMWHSIPSVSQVRSPRNHQNLNWLNPLIWSRDMPRDQNCTITEIEDMETKRFFCTIMMLAFSKDCSRVIRNHRLNFGLRESRSRAVEWSWWSVVGFSEALSLFVICYPTFDYSRFYTH